MPVKDLTRFVTDAAGANRNWEVLFGLRTDQVELEDPTEDSEPANKGYVDAQIGGGTTPTGPASGALDGNYPGPGLASSVAGNGLVESSDVLSVNVDGTTIDIADDVLRVSTGGITAAQIANDAVTADEIAADAVGASELADDSVASANIIDGAIVNADVNASAAIATTKLSPDPLARANHTGTQLAATVSDFDTQVRTSTLNQMAAPTTSLSFANNKGINLADPTLAQDAATKAYVDAAAVVAAAGFSLKDPVRVATTANISYSTISALIMTGTGTVTVDGVLLVTGDRVLLKDQSLGAENGIWEFTTTGTLFGAATTLFGGGGTFGDTGTAWTLTRTSDADTDAEVDTGMFVPVTEGTANLRTTWLLTTADPITIGTTSLAFSQFTATPVGVAGGSLTGTYPNPTFSASGIGETQIPATIPTATSYTVASDKQMPIGEPLTINGTGELVVNGDVVDTDETFSEFKTVPTNLASEETFIVGPRRQQLFGEEITVDGTGSLVVEGSLIDVTSFGSTGTYTPTIRNGANIDSITAAECQWMRVGSMVTVSGSVTVDQTTAAGTTTSLFMSLPVPSDLTASGDLRGTSNTSASTESFVVFGDVTNNEAQLGGICVNTASEVHSFVYMYEVK